MSQDIFQVKRVLAVLCGGFLGTLARYAISLWIQGFMGKSWPYDILLINITGAFAIAALTTLAEAALFIGPTRRLFFNVGFLGAYTTFSTLALGSVSLVENNKPFLSLLYLVCSLVGGIFAILLGQITGAWIVNRVRYQHVSMKRAASLKSLRDEEQLY